MGRFAVAIAVSLPPCPPPRPRPAPGQHQALWARDLGSWVSVAALGPWTWGGGWTMEEVIELAMGSCGHGIEGGRRHAEHWEEERMGSSKRRILLICLFFATICWIHPWRVFVAFHGLS